MTIALAELAPNLRGIILDMDGVLWRSTTPIGNLPSIFKTLNNLGLKVIMATNNATRSPDQYVNKLASFGVKIGSWQVINSAMVTAHYLKTHYPDGGDVFVVGDNSLMETLNQHGYNPNGSDPIAVVVALDRRINYEKLTQAALLIRRGVQFIGTNPDKSFPIPEGEAPGAGAILAALEAATDVSPLIMGKPRPRMYNLALTRLGTLPGETLVVGDRLETDILGAQNTGCPNALVLSGVTALETANLWQPPPDIISKDLTSLLDLLAQAM
jgi:4-nitrophenyl phosphatase